MSDPNPRAAGYAAVFEETQRGFIALVESLTDEQWRRPGRNYPQRLNGEDEDRPVAVIAHHVAVSGPFILGRIQEMLAGRPRPPADFRALNARHAAEHGGVTREEVLRILRETMPEIAAGIRGIPDPQLDLVRETPAGPLTVAQRIERVLIGHVRMHQGSIQAAVSE